MCACRLGVLGFSNAGELCTVKPIDSGKQRNGEKRARRQPRAWPRRPRSAHATVQLEQAAACGSKSKLKQACNWRDM